MASQELISEIQEYSIMFTYNITQKLKKWNDGTLKFYKFNNKVQVFNDQSILISQEFLKNDRNLQEEQWGSEVKMGGVLVMIDSMLSESKREISGLFEKNKDQGKVIPKETVVVCRKNEGIRTPLKSLSPMTQGKRRVGLSKSMTPSRMALRKVGNEELNTRSETPSVEKRSVQPKPTHTPNPKKIVPKITTKDNLPKKRKLAPFTPISIKQPKISSSIDELSTLESPSLIKSDRHLLLAPEPTISPSRDSNRDSISWDDESLENSNSKIIDKIKLQTPTTPRTRIVKRIGRSKREVIKIQPEVQITPIISTKKSNIQVYASDSGSESDEIVSQSQSQDGNLRNDKITQTETYDYNSKSENKTKRGLRVSDITL